jgi:serine/threonine protein kinase
MVITSPNTPLQDERFLMLETLGRGSMGSVYRAYDRVEQRLVALKVPTDDEPSGPAHSLSSEFDTWHRLRHRNIVRAYELGLARRGPIQPGTPYLVLEHVTGGPIHRTLSPGRLSDEATVEIATQLLEALDLVHRAGFVHRDLKPANVLTSNGSDRATTVRLTDFGLAARIGAAREPGVFSGSVPYVAPEALVGDRLDGRADLYGLGILLYHLTTGLMPCRSQDPRKILHWHLTGPPADPRVTNPSVSRRLARFVERLTSRNRESRPATAAAALELLGASPTLAPSPVSRPLGRGVQASLRLSLDAARLGAARTFRLPANPETAEALLTEVSVWTQVRGIEMHRVDSSKAGLARLVVRLALERGRAGTDRMRDLDLDRSLPLNWLGKMPILDPLRAETDRAVRGPGVASDSARRICEFVWRCASEQSLVVCFGAGSVGDPLGRQVANRLARTTEQATRFSPGRGGLLVLLSPDTGTRAA